MRAPRYSGQWTAACAMGASAIVAAAQPVDFARDIRPILAANCFKCHGPDAAARQAKLRLDTREGATALNRRGSAAVAPGDPDASEMLHRVLSDDPDERMPPPEVSRDGLSAEQVERLLQWIAAGAPWSDHWSFVAPAERPPPRVSDPSWCRGDIDRWVLARLDRERLSPSPDAERSTLLRRVSLDLIGLPPTPEEVQAFAADSAAGAYERAVDRLLASPRFGEKWARWWLDLARYADTKGYEKDARRPMWPYRDWVIRALNEDMPLDRFALEQLAGDLLPEPSQDQLIATAFHRNTMTNDEGGTDNEEFRVAAVVDRVNTTSEVWLGLTMSCVQCHTHKFDPIPHEDYYRLFAIFNSTQDEDRDDEAPVLRVLPPDTESALREVERALAVFEPRIKEARSVADPAPGAPTKPVDGPRDLVWIDDALPAAASPRVEGLETPIWPWRRGGGDPPGIGPHSGTLFFGARANHSGPAQQFVIDADPPLAVAAGDSLFAHVYIDPEHMPKQIVLQWHTAEAKWEQRAYWGESVDSYYGGKNGTESLRRIGDLPAPGRWVRLEVPAAAVGLEGRRVTGWAFTQTGGTVYWDQAGVRTTSAPDLGPAGAASRAALAAIDAERLPLLIRKQGLEAAAVALPVMRERPEPRATHRLVRGSFLNPAERVDPGVPGCLPALGPAPSNRREFARWLFAEGQPLTGRVLANRVWEQLFGTGLVETLEDFGIQGAAPSHPELMDHLAVSLRAKAWSLKALIREIVTSSTYRQSSSVSAELIERDPANRLLARGPRFRLDGEMIRDQALAVSGLLSPKMYGPPVFPPQPDGLWIMIYSGDKWVTSTGEDRYRRAVYTFARRTVPYPSMTTFDAPSREVCVSRRIRTNTPLQAFVTLNDPAFVECAQALARRVLAHPGPDRDRIAHAFRLALAREPADAEAAELAALLADQRTGYRADPAAALSAATIPLGALPPDMHPVEAAAWTAVAGVLLNLDEILTKE